MLFAFRKNNLAKFHNSGGHLASARWLLLVFISVLLATVVSCGGPEIVEKATPEFGEVDSDVAFSENENPSQKTDSQFEMQEIEQLSSPFTKETVLALNAIVARSLAAIDAFDEARKVQDDSDEGLDAKLKQYTELSIKAVESKSDMDDAGNRLRNGDEKYNEAIFEAMVRFVDGVDKEIREEIDAVHQKMSVGDK